MAKLTLILLALLTSRASGRLPTYQPTDQPVQWCANRGDDCDSASECCDGRACYERRGHEAYGTCETSCPDDDEYACRSGNAQPAYQPTYKPTQSGGGDCADDETWEYLAGDKGPKGCDHVASEPDKVVKRCVNRQSDDGVWAYEACPKTCGTCGTVEYKNWGMQRGWCYSELNDDVGVAKSVGECWDMCEAEYGQSLVAIDLDDYCYCQTDCQCLDDVEEDPTYLVATRRSITELPQEC